MKKLAIYRMWGKRIGAPIILGAAKTNTPEEEKKRSRGTRGNC
jgi:hypothetical protein